MNLTRLSNITAGQIYRDVIARERAGEFLGGTIQAIPHVTDAIKQRILELADDSGADVIVVEVGGTVGDIEGLPFLEAIRQMRNEVGRDNVYYIHLTFLPFISSTEELKTKPTQHSVRELRSIGIQPDAILCRSDHEVDEDIKMKISIHCDVPNEAVLTLPTVSSIYEVPLILQDEGLGRLIADALNLKTSSDDLVDWRKMVEAIRSPKSQGGSADRYCRQIRRSARLVHIGKRIAAACRAALQQRHRRPLDQLGAGGTGRPGRASRVGGRNRGARRLRSQRLRGYDRNRQVRAQPRCSVPRPMPGNASDGRRSRAQPAGTVPAPTPPR